MSAENWAARWAKLGERCRPSAVAPRRSMRTAVALGVTIFCALFAVFGHWWALPYGRVTALLLVVFFGGGLTYALATISHWALRCHFEQTPPSIDATLDVDHPAYRIDAIPIGLGVIERTTVFCLLSCSVSADKVATIAMAWLALKLASGWNQRTADKSAPGTVVPNGVGSSPPAASPTASALQLGGADAESAKSRPSHPPLSAAHHRSQAMVGLIVGLISIGCAFVGGAMARNEPPWPSPEPSSKAAAAAPPASTN